MEIISKSKYDVVFWKESHDEEWQQAKLSEVVAAYVEEPYCEMEYWTAVHPESDETKDLYHLWICSKCGIVSASLDKEHDFNYCPHCGKAVWKE